MPSLPADLETEARTNAIVWEILEELVDIGNRMAGQDGEKAGADYVADTFDDLGLSDVTRSEFDVPGWWRGHSKLTITGDRQKEFTHQHELLALPGTPPADVTAEIIDLGDGAPDAFETRDVHGKLVLASSRSPGNYERWVHRNEKYGLAVENGAAGFLFYNDNPGCLPITGSVNDETGPGPIPAVGLSRELGKRLQRYCRRGPVTAELEIACRNEPSTSRNVEGILGPSTGAEVLVSAHVDAHDINDGATDDGVGCAEVCEIARLLATIEDSLSTPIRFVVFGAEEIGLLGAHHWVETHDPDDVEGVINVDGNGTWSDVTVYTHGSSGLEGLFHDVDSAHDLPISVTDDFLPHGDQWAFVQREIPGVLVRSESADGRGWGHTHGDTIDKLDRSDLERLAVVLTDSVLRLAEPTRTVESASSREIQRALSDTGYETGMRATGDWPWE